MANFEKSYISKRVNEKITKIKIILLELFLVGCHPAQITINESNTKSYVGKTHLYLGNSFEQRHKSKIDTLNYTWRDSSYNEKLVLREYPKYQGQFYRKESYEYYKDGEPKKH